MQYAIVSGHRREAFPGGQGDCPTCGSEMVAKCGPRVIHHWAHAGRRNCDPWWENETLWHREWKNLFHRADIKSPTGIVIEVQHSSMTDAERLSREKFYGNLVWIVDGRGFRQNFDIYHMLPDPSSELAQDLIWAKATRPMKGAAMGLFFRLSECRRENPEATRANIRGGILHPLRNIEKQVEQEYRGHHQYDWVRPRRTWLDATCSVYLDLGDEWLARLEQYDETGLPCVRLVAKRKLVHDSMVETTASAIATRFYPIVRN
jgi:competence protein CoiA